MTGFRKGSGGSRFLGHTASAKEHESGDHQARGAGQGGSTNDGVPGENGQKPLPARGNTFSIEPWRHHYEGGQNNGRQDGKQKQQTSEQTETSPRLFVWHSCLLRTRMIKFVDRTFLSGQDGQECPSHKQQQPEKSHRRDAGQNSAP